jgi:hypothetical protein
MTLLLERMMTILLDVLLLVAVATRIENFLRNTVYILLCSITCELNLSVLYDHKLYETDL